MPGSPRFAVAIHVLAVLAFIERKGGERVSSSQIAMSVNTNPVVIRNLLKALKDAGLIRVKEGRGGGIRLGRIVHTTKLAGRLAGQRRVGGENRASLRKVQIDQALQPFRGVGNAAQRGGNAKLRI